MFDDLEPKKTSEFPTIGSDLSALSVADLEKLKEIYSEEIARIEAAITARHLSKDTAQSFFKK